MFPRLGPDAPAGRRHRWHGLAARLAAAAAAWGAGRDGGLRRRKAAAIGHPRRCKALSAQGLGSFTVPVSVAQRVFAALAVVLRLQASLGAQYVHDESYVGTDFFDRWDFFTGPDPTHGAVQYVNYDEAVAAGLIRATTGQVYMGADMATAIAPNGRRSVRVESKAAYNGGLFVVTLDHIPAGCGMWPAFWMFGFDAAHQWPEWGEFDIVEGVDKQTRVQTTLHTTDGCSQAAVVQGQDFSGTWGVGQTASTATNCYIHAPGQFDHQGCVQRGPVGSIGPGFNAQGGGTFAAEWDPVGQRFRTWFWPAGSEPLDLVARRPDPDTWGVPYSFFSLSPDACPSTHFVNMRLVFDLTFCGDLGGPHYAESCPEVAQQISCFDMVTTQPGSMSEAFWLVRVLDTYQSSSAAATGKGGGGPPVWPVVLFLLLMAAGLGRSAVYVLDRLSNPGDNFPPAWLHDYSPRFWAAASAFARKYTPNGVMASVQVASLSLARRAQEFSVRLCPVPCEHLWQQLPLPLSQEEPPRYPTQLSVGDEVVVRTAFHAPGRWFGSSTLEPDTKGMVEEVREHGTVVIRFSSHSGAYIVTREQFVHLAFAGEESPHVPTWKHVSVVTL